MNRRSFLQSMSVAFSAVAFGVRPNFAQTPLKIRYELFADTQCFRYDLDQPFSLDGAIYATDSRFLITHPGEWTGMESGKVPNVARLWWGEFDKPGWKDLPAQKLELRSDHLESLCHRCMGTGRVGDGVHRVPDKDQDGDAYWRWAGGERCPFCDHGWDRDVCNHERIGPAVFCPGRMNRLRTLGHLDYRVIMVDPCDLRPNGLGHVLLVRGDNGLKGMLCSMCE
jgi:hypothetical protein